VLSARVDGVGHVSSVPVGSVSSSNCTRGLFAGASINRVVMVKVVVDAVIVVVVAIILVVVYLQLQDSSTQEPLSKVTLPKHDSSDFDFNCSLDLDRQYLKLGRQCFCSCFFIKYCEPIRCYLI